MPSTTVIIEFDRFPEIIAGLEAKAAAAVAETAHEIQADAASRAPVRTGALRRSIVASPEGALAWVVAVGMYYGIYQEFGTYKMPAHPFLIPAALAAMPKLLARMAEALA